MALESRQCAIYEEQSVLQIPVFLVSNYHLATARERQPIQCFARVEIWCFNKMFGSSAQCPPATYTWGESANERGGGRFRFSEPESFVMTMFMVGSYWDLRGPTPQSPPGVLATQPSCL